MIKLNAHKDSVIQFEINIKNMSEKGLKGHFRLIHEKIEYGFPVKILGNKTKVQVTIPALNGIIADLTETAKFNAKLEFVGGGDYVQAWSDKAKINVLPKAKVMVQEDSVTVSEEEDKTLSVSAMIENIEVSDETWATVKPRPKKKLTEAEIEAEEKEYNARQAAVKSSIDSDDGFGAFYKKG